MSIDSTPAHTQTNSTVNMSPTTSYPGKGIGYDWQAVIAEVEAALLDAIRPICARCDKCHKPAGFPSVAGVLTLIYRREVRGGDEAVTWVRQSS